MDNTLQTIEKDVQNNKILLYMKGEKKFPQCGFSHIVTSILNKYNVEYETRNVLADEKMRQKIKEFSNWQTIPQLYINSEFIGGSDIVQEMEQSGELKELLEKL